jgi:hypothetical protein
MASDGDTRVTVPQVPSANRAVDLSRVEMASDGNAYVMRWTNPAVFYAISPGGEVVRRFTVDPGNGGYRPAAMHVTKDRIAVLFYDPQTNDKIMRVVDLEGHTMATYDELRANGKPVGDPIGTAFACYTQSPERFTFVGSQGGNFQLWIAEAR